MSAIVGSGAAVTDGAGVSPQKLELTVAAWIGSLALAFVLGYGSILLLER